MEYPLPFLLYKSATVNFFKMYYNWLYGVVKKDEVLNVDNLFYVSIVAKHKCVEPIEIHTNGRALQSETITQGKGWFKYFLI